jgi:hypothetical protein
VRDITPTDLHKDTVDGRFGSDADAVGLARPQLIFILSEV